MTGALAEPAAASRVLPENPYVGLVPYEEADAPFFFGRRGEQTIVTANLRAARLTLLYGPSGVGKTSLLHAGVVHDLRRLVRRGAGPDRAPFAVAVLSSWRDDPLQVVAGAIRQAAEEALGDELAPWQPGQSLVEALGGWTKRVRTLLVVLDQFEDYFLYHPGEDGPGTFAVEFPAAVNEPNLRVNFLLSIREDALAKLDRFEGRISNLFGNYLRVDYPDREQARQAIVGPIEEYNRRLPAGEEPYRLEPALVEAVVEAASSGRLALAAADDGHAPEEAASDRVETPFLQLVMERLWRESAETGSRQLSVATLERLGGAQRIVETHLAEALGRLSEREQELAADLFRFLVTRSKTKIAHGGSDLADWAKRPPAEVQRVLERLTRGESGRILRPIAPPAKGGETRYEIFHDVLAEPILEWRARMEQERARRAGLRRQRRLRAVLAGLLAIGAGLTALSVWALHERGIAASKTRTARSEALASEAEGQLGVDPERALLLGLAALGEKHTNSAETALRDALRVSRVRAVLRGHQGPVSAASFSPDGRQVLTAGADGTARLWRATDGTPVATLGGGHGPILDAAFSPDGRSIVTAGSDGTARILRVANGRQVRALRPPGGLSAAAFAPDGKTLVTAGPADATAWRLSDGRVERVFSPGVPVLGAAFSPDGSRLITATVDGSARIWRVADGRQLAVLRGHRGPVVSAAFSPDGKRVLTVAQDYTARVWGATDGRTVAVFSASEAGFVLSAAFSPDSRLVVTTGQDGAVRLWPVTGGNPLLELRGHVGFVFGASFSSDGRRLVTAGADGTARIWDAATEPPGRFLRGQGGAIIRAALSPDGALLVTPTESGSAPIWQVATGRAKYVLHAAGFLDAAAFSPDGKLVVTGGQGTAQISSVATGRSVATLGAAHGVTAIAFSPDGKLLVTGADDGTVRVWDTGSWRVLALLRGHSGFVLGAVFSPDGKLLATGGQDGTARVWSVPGFRTIRILRGGNGVFDAAFSPDGRLLITANQDGTARIWQLASGRTLTVLRGHTAWVTSASYSPDGKLILTSSGDGTVRLWQASTGLMLAVLTGHSGAVYDAFFTPDGQRIVSTGEDGNAWIYPLSACHTCRPLQDLLTLARSRVTRQLTPDERQEFGIGS